MSKVFSWIDSAEILFGLHLPHIFYQTATLLS